MKTKCQAPLFQSINPFLSSTTNISIYLILMIVMEEVASGDVMQFGVLLQDSSSYINGNFVNCVLMNEKYQEVSMELKSLRLINNILHEEIKTLRNQQEDKALREGSFTWCKKKKGVVCSVQVL